MKVLRYLSLITVLHLALSVPAYPAPSLGQVPSGGKLNVAELSLKELKRLDAVYAPSKSEEKTTEAEPRCGTSRCVPAGAEVTDVEDGVAVTSDDLGEMFVVAGSRAHVAETAARHASSRTIAE